MVCKTIASRTLSVLASITFLVSFFTTQVIAAPTQPTLPTEKEYLGNLFNLFKFMNPEDLQLIENKDLTRKDIRQKIISDTRPARCTVGAEDACKGGQVVLENEVSPGNFERQTLPSILLSGRCVPNVKAVVTDPNTTNQEANEGLPGFCDYNKYPSNGTELTSVDYSKGSGLAYPKIQNTTAKYGAIGQSNNLASWGMHTLIFDAKEQYALKAIALAQAAESENTYSDTGEWALGATMFDAPIDPTDINSPSYLEVWRKLNQAADGSAASKIKQAAETLNSLYWPTIVLPYSPDRALSKQEEELIKNSKDTIYNIIAEIQQVPKPTIDTSLPTCKTEAGYSVYTNEIVIGPADMPYRCSSGSWQDSPGSTITVKPTYLGGGNCYLQAGQLVIGNGSIYQEGAITKKCQNGQVTSFDKQESQESWLKDFLRTPICAPGITRGYTFISKCAMGTCTWPLSDAPQTPIIDHINGKQGTFSDHTARQDLCYAVIELRRSMTQPQSEKVLKKLSKQNVLYQYSLFGNTSSIPTRVINKLEQANATKTSSIKVFSINWFHKVIDGWRSTDGKYWYEKLGYSIQSKKTPEVAAAYEEPGFFGVIANYISISITRIFSNGIDRVFQVLDHHVNLMSIQRHMVDQLNEAINSKDLTIDQQDAQNTLASEYQNSVGNTVGESLNIGNRTAPISGKTSFSWILACGMKAYSTFGTPIKDYIQGLKQSCFESSVNLDKLGYMCKGKAQPGSGITKLCNVNPVSKGYLKGQSISSLSPTFIAVIESAAVANDVPAALILADMIGEGGFERSYDFSDEGVKVGSMCKGKLTSCGGADGNVSSEGGTGPFQILAAWFKPEDGDRCNLYDGAMWVGKQIKAEVDGNPTWSDTSCVAMGSNYQYNQGSWSGSWSDTDVVTAARALRGMCDPDFLTRVLQAYKDYSCR